MQITDSIEHIDIVASAIIQAVNQRTVLAFHGNLGAGKTTLIKAICDQLGVETGMSSPTFNIVNEYQTKTGAIIYHFDCYRLNDPVEAYDIGIEEYFHSGHVCLIEWPENLGYILPDDAVHITITANTPHTRTYTIA